MFNLSPEKADRAAVVMGDSESTNGWDACLRALPLVWLLFIINKMYYSTL